MIKKKKVGGGAVPDDDPVCRISPMWKKKEDGGRKDGPDSHPHLSKISQ